VRSPRHRLDPSRQPIEALPHIGDAACQLDADIAGNADHDSADNTWRDIASSTAPVRRSFTPDGSFTSITPIGRLASAGVKRMPGVRQFRAQPPARIEHRA
jgi:hypothetical protein